MKTENRYGLWGLEPETQRIKTPIDVPLRNHKMPENPFEKGKSIPAIVAIEVRDNEYDLLDLKEGEEVDILYCYVESGGDLPCLYYTLHNYVDTYEGAKTFVMGGSRAFVPEKLSEEKMYILDETNTLGGKPTVYMGKLEEIAEIHQRRYEDKAGVGEVRFIYTFDKRNRWVIRDFFVHRRGEPYVMSNENMEIIMENKDSRVHIW